MTGAFGGAGFLFVGWFDLIDDLDEGPLGCVAVALGGGGMIVVDLLGGLAFGVLDELGQGVDLLLGHGAQGGLGIAGLLAQGIGAVVELVAQVFRIETVEGADVAFHGGIALEVSRRGQGADAGVFLTIGFEQTAGDADVFLGGVLGGLDVDEGVVEQGHGGLELLGDRLDAVVDGGDGIAGDFLHPCHVTLLAVLIGGAGLLVGAVDGGIAGIAVGKAVKALPDHDAGCDQADDEKDQGILDGQEGEGIGEQGGPGLEQFAIGVAIDETAVVGDIEVIGDDGGDAEEGGEEADGFGHPVDVEGKAQAEVTDAQAEQEVWDAHEGGDGGAADGAEVGDLCEELCVDAGLQEEGDKDEGDGEQGDLGIAGLAVETVGAAEGLALAVVAAFGDAGGDDVLAAALALGLEGELGIFERGLEVPFAV